MEPRLVAMAGPMEGTVFALAEKEVGIGRDPANRICLSGAMVSRKHCILLCEGGQYVLQDLESSNGTLVNDVPIRERTLTEGDRITIGDTLFLFLIGQPDNVRSSSTYAPFDDGNVATRTTFIVEVEKATYLQPEKVGEALSPADRIASDLNVLLKISRAIGQIRNVEDLRKQLLALILEAIPAERGAILLDKDRFDATAQCFYLDRAGNQDRQFMLSRTIVDQVRNEGVALLSNDVEESTSLRTVSSLVISRARSLLAVPIMLEKQALGVIYLDSSNPQTIFDEAHLQLASAIAGLAAVAFDNVRQWEWLAGENRRLRAEISLEHDMIGESAQMKSIYQMIARVAPSESTVLILGESGTGKELAARAIHRLSPRAEKPFIAINCAGLSETLLESDLFGHEKGAFTGAVAQKKGKLEIADGGTVFLDELGELPLQLQAKLLRAIQTREFERVGGTRSLKVDIRLIAATNRDLEASIKSGEFRSDLYYRLNVVSLKMPALRERRDDILLLAYYFAVKYGQRCKRTVKGLAPATKRLLVSYDWPGNVRELENVIERAVVLGTTEIIQPEDLPESLQESALPAGGNANNFQMAAREAKKQIVIHALEAAGGNYTQAAKTLGMHPNNLHRLLRSLGLKSV